MTRRPARRQRILLVSAGTALVVALAVVLAVVRPGSSAPSGQARPPG